MMLLGAALKAARLCTHATDSGRVSHCTMARGKNKYLYASLDVETCLKVMVTVP